MAVTCPLPVTIRQQARLGRITARPSVRRLVLSPDGDGGAGGWAIGDLYAWRPKRQPDPSEWATAGQAPRHRVDAWAMEMAGPKGPTPRRAVAVLRVCGEYDPHAPDPLVDVRLAWTDAAEMLPEPHQRQLVSPVTADEAAAGAPRMGEHIDAFARRAAGRHQWGQPWWMGYGPGHWDPDCLGELHDAAVTGLARATRETVLHDRHLADACDVACGAGLRPYAIGVSGTPGIEAWWGDLIGGRASTELWHVPMPSMFVGRV